MSYEVNGAPQPTVPLLLSEEVRFTSHPEARPAVEGQRLELSCEATGVPQPNFLWFKEREPLPSHTSNKYTNSSVFMHTIKCYMCFTVLPVALPRVFSRKVLISFFPHCRLVIEKVSQDNEGNYCCRASNEVSTEFSNWVEVTVHKPHRTGMPSLYLGLASCFC